MSNTAALIADAQFIIDGMEDLSAADRATILATALAIVMSNASPTLAAATESARIASAMVSDLTLGHWREKHPHG